MRRALSLMTLFMSALRGRAIALMSGCRDVFYPTAMPPRSDLMLLHPDGTEETLVSARNGAVLDPVVSFDAQWVYYSYIPDNTTATGINYQRGLSVTGGALTGRIESCAIESLL